MLALSLALYDCSCAHIHTRRRKTTITKAATMPAISSTKAISRLWLLFLQQLRSLFPYVARRVLSSRLISFVKLV